MSQASTRCDVVRQRAVPYLGAEVRTIKSYVQYIA